MYFCIYPSCEYNSDEACDIDDNELCLICLSPKEKNNEIKFLTDFSNIKVNCKCNPKIHYICLNDWVIKTQSCPICRKEIKLIVISSNNKNSIVYFCVISIEYIIYFFKILYYSSLINLCCLIFYNTYNIYLITNTDYRDNYG